MLAIAIRWLRGMVASLPWYAEKPGTAGVGQRRLPSWRRSDHNSEHTRGNSLKKQAELSRCTQRRQPLTRSGA